VQVHANGFDTAWEGHKNNSPVSLFILTSDTFDKLINLIVFLRSYKLKRNEWYL
jgi:hypothetical protein